MWCAYSAGSGVFWTEASLREMRRSIPIIASFCLGALAAQVQLGNTIIFGNQTHLLLEFYGGIPYAEPPIGDLRLRPPVLKRSPDVDEYNGSLFGPGFESSSEGCLSVNMHRPTDSVRLDRQLPATVFDHGVGFLVLSSAQ
ncbi:hypothetical protein PM082_020279 [Marasmius tenuissimus]|nr:hypothetical protein PM082_020279 [Marasmius tenuissimus]